QSSIRKLEDIIKTGTTDEIHAHCISEENALAKVILKGLHNRRYGSERMEKVISVSGSIEVAKLERGLSILSSIGTLAPMVGFLGTVSGMIQAFGKIAAASSVSPRLVAGGIEEALLTTAAGLIVGIPSIFSYNYFVHRIDIFVSDINRISADLVEGLLEETHA
ncbi:MAG: MotA/TolQ/ExbB proton channel family protein, partial [Clostridia bacterium]|nr:MotA/TolQ/ExbB proton channel family protein [Clostridia bacterium]